MSPIRLMTHRINNLLHSVSLILALVALLWLIGWLFAGIYGVIWSTTLGILPLAASLRINPFLVLKMYGARPLAEFQAPQIFGIMTELCRRAALPTPPALYLIEGPSALVFSIGRRDKSAIAVSEGLLRLLDLREFVGVLGHEISHIRNSDTWVMSFADVVSRITGLMSIVGQLLVLVNLPLFIFGGYGLPWLPLLIMIMAPVASSLLQLALSRTREFNADLNAASFTGDPAGLAGALAKLEEYQLRVMERSRLSGQWRSGPSLLRTHPSTNDRVKRLLEMEAELERFPEELLALQKPHFFSMEPGKSPVRRGWFR